MSPMNGAGLGGGAGRLDGAGRADELAGLRRQMNRLSGETGLPAGTAAGMTAAGMPSAGMTSAGRVAVPEVLESLFPRRGLPRGAVTAVSGASVIPMSIIAEASRAGCTVALVGVPRLNLAAAVEMGADLGRIAVIAEPGVDRLAVAAILLDGLDLVVLGFEDRLGPTGSSVTPARTRVLAGRARKQSSALMVLGEWPGTATRIRGEVRGYRHLPARRSGYGRIGGLRVQVEVSAPGARSVDESFDLVVPGVGESAVMRLAVAGADAGMEQDRFRHGLAVANRPLLR